MLPGSGAYGSKPSPDPTPTPTPKEPAEARAIAPSRDEPSVTPEKTTGNLFWNGKIYKNGRIRISVDNQTTAGYVEGDPLPGVPAVVDARSPIVEIIEQPSARNGYKSFEFRVKKSSKDKISLNFHWMLANP